jgi:hypothetical protein
MNTIKGSTSQMRDGLQPGSKKNNIYPGPACLALFGRIRITEIRSAQERIEPAPSASRRSGRLAVRNRTVMQYVGNELHSFAQTHVVGQASAKIELG